MFLNNTWVGSVFYVYDPNWQLEVSDLKLKSPFEDKAISNDDLEGKIVVFLWHFTYPKNNYFSVEKLNKLVATFKGYDNVLFFFACPHSGSWAKRFVRSTGLKFTPISNLLRSTFQYKNILTAPIYFIYKNGKIMSCNLSDHVNIDELLTKKIYSLF